VAENPGSAHSDGLPLTGEPDSFGYDSDGNRMPYTDSRPSCGPAQVEDVWNASMDENGEVWVRDRDGDLVQIEWRPGESRDGLWDMGHPSTSTRIFTTRTSTTRSATTSSSTDTGTRATTGWSILGGTAHTSTKLRSVQVAGLNCDPSTA
jgi:hypothetical protein